MFERVLKKMREKVRTRQYIVTVHAEEEIIADDLNIFDVEEVILTGKITERQRDKQTGEWKYRVTGRSIDERRAEVIAKISPTHKLVVITVYAVDEI